MTERMDCGTLVLGPTCLDVALRFGVLRRIGMERWTSTGEVALWMP